MSLFDSIFILLFSAVIISAIFQRLRLPHILDYLVVGILLGPKVLNLIPDDQDTHHVAEFGIVFLMFTIGLEFSLSRLSAMRTTVFGLGSLQVIGTFVPCVVVGKLIGMQFSEAIIASSVVSMSSTAIVLKQLADQDQLQQTHSYAAIGILLFQDIAVIPLMLLIPSLANGHVSEVLLDIIFSVIKGGISVVIILAIGHWLLRPLFYEITRKRSSELFTLTVLCVTLGAAWLTERFGLSMALGAFFAGMMLGETEFRHQIETDLKPFKDIFLGLFFISIGTQLNIPIIYQEWPCVLLLLFALIIGKFLLITLVSFLFKNKLVNAIRTGIVLAQGGEFGFAILSLAMTYHLLPTDYHQVMLSGLLLSMAIAPFLIRANKSLVMRLFKEKIEAETQEAIDWLAQNVQHLENHVIICGYGRTGQHIARLLESLSISYVALDLDSERVRMANQAGDFVVYGDATNSHLLEGAGIKSARAMVLSFYHRRGSCKLIELARKQNPYLPVIARSHDDADMERLLECGASEVVPETMESSLMLTTHLLLLMGLPTREVSDLIHKARASRYNILRFIFPKQQSTLLENDESPPTKGLYTIVLHPEEKAVGRKIAVIARVIKPLTIMMIKRDGKRIQNPEKNLVLAAGDAIVLYGELARMEAAQNILLGRR